jgi:hypothetical protein
MYVLDGANMAFAGSGYETILSHAYGALFPMFDTKDALVLRQVCLELKETVAAFPWEDKKTVIKGRVAAWRACFPKARCALMKNRTKVANMVHLVGVTVFVTKVSIMLHTACCFPEDAHKTCITTAKSISHMLRHNKRPPTNIFLGCVLTLWPHACPRELCGV